jgi:hypothetical protein
MQDALQKTLIQSFDLRDGAGVPPRLPDQTDHPTGGKSEPCSSATNVRSATAKRIPGQLIKGVCNQCGHTAEELQINRKLDSRNTLSKFLDKWPTRRLQTKTLRHVFGTGHLNAASSGHRYAPINMPLPKMPRPNSHFKNALSSGSEAQQQCRF